MPRKSLNLLEGVLRRSESARWTKPPASVPLSSSWHDGTLYGLSQDTGPRPDPNRSLTGCNQPRQEAAPAAAAAAAAEGSESHGRTTLRSHTDWLAENWPRISPVHRTEEGGPERHQSQGVTVHRGRASQPIEKGIRKKPCPIGAGPRGGVLLRPLRRSAVTLITQSCSNCLSPAIPEYSPFSRAPSWTPVGLKGGFASEVSETC